MKRNIGFYVEHKTTGQRVFLEKQFKWDRWYYSADGWTTQDQTKIGAIRSAGKA